MGDTLGRILRTIGVDAAAESGARQVRSAMEAAVRANAAAAPQRASDLLARRAALMQSIEDGQRAIDSGGASMDPAERYALVNQIRTANEQLGPIDFELSRLPPDVLAAAIPGYRGQAPGRVAESPFVLAGGAVSFGRQPAELPAAATAPASGAQDSLRGAVEQTLGGDRAAPLRSMRDIVARLQERRASAADASDLAAAIDEAISSGLSARFSGSPYGGMAVPEDIGELRAALNAVLDHPKAAIAVNTLASRAGVPTVVQRMQAEGINLADAVESSLAEILSTRQQQASGALEEARSRGIEVGGMPAGSTRAPTNRSYQDAVAPEAVDRPGIPQPAAMEQLGVTSFSLPPTASYRVAIDPATGRPIPEYKPGPLEFDPNAPIQFVPGVFDLPTGRQATASPVGTTFAPSQENIPSVPPPNAPKNSSEYLAWKYPFPGVVRQENSGTFATRVVTDDNGNRVTVPDYDMPIIQMELPRTGDGGNRSAESRIWMVRLKDGRYQQLGVDPQTGGDLPPTEVTRDQIRSMLQRGFRVTSGAIDVAPPNLPPPDVVGQMVLEATKGGADAASIEAIKNHIADWQLLGTSDQVSQIAAAAGAGARDLGAQRINDLLYPPRDAERQALAASSRAADEGARRAARVRQARAAAEKQTLAQFAAQRGIPASDVSSDSMLPFTARQEARTESKGQRGPIPVGASQAPSASTSAMFSPGAPVNPALQGLGWRKEIPISGVSSAAQSLPLGPSMRGPGGRFVSTPAGATSTTDLVLPADATFVSDVVSPSYVTTLGSGSPGVSSGIDTRVSGGTVAGPLSGRVEPPPSISQLVARLLSSRSPVDASDPEAMASLDRVFPVGVAAPSDPRLNFTVGPGTWASGISGRAGALARMLQTSRFDAGADIASGVSRPIDIGSGTTLARMRPDAMASQQSVGASPQAIQGIPKVAQEGIVDPRLLRGAEASVQADFERLAEKRRQLLSQSRAVAKQIGDLTRSGQPVPDALRSTLARLQSGYDRLSERSLDLGDPGSDKRAAVVERVARAREGSRSVKAGTDDIESATRVRDAMAQLSQSAAEDPALRVQAGIGADDAEATSKELAGLIPKSDTQAPLSVEQLRAIYDASVKKGKGESRPIGLRDYDARDSQSRPGHSLVSKYQDYEDSVSEAEGALARLRKGEKTLRQRLKKAGREGLESGRIRDELEATRAAIDSAKADLESARSEFESFKGSLGADRRTAVEGSGDNQARLVDAVMNAETALERRDAVAQLLTPQRVGRGKGYRWEGDSLSTQPNSRKMALGNKPVSFQPYDAEQVLDAMVNGARQSGASLPEGDEAAHIIYSILKGNTAVDSSFSDAALMDAARKAVADIRSTAARPVSRETAVAPGRLDSETPHPMDKLFSSLPEVPAAGAPAMTPEQASAALSQVAYIRKRLDDAVGAARALGTGEEAASSAAGLYDRLKAVEDAAQASLRSGVRTTPQVNAKPFASDDQARFEKLRQRASELISLQGKDESAAGELEKVMEELEALRGQLPAGHPEARNPGEVEPRATPVEEFSGEGNPGMAGRAYLVSSPEEAEQISALLRADSDAAASMQGDAGKVHSVTISTRSPGEGPQLKPFIGSLRPVDPNANLPVGTTVLRFDMYGRPSLSTKRPGPSHPLSGRAYVVSSPDDLQRIGSLLRADPDPVARMEQKGSGSHFIDLSASVSGPKLPALPFRGALTPVDPEAPLPAGTMVLRFDENGRPSLSASNGKPEVSVVDQRGVDSSMGDEYINPAARPAGMDTEVSAAEPSAAAPNPQAGSARTRRERVDAARAARVVEEGENEALALTARGGRPPEVSAEGRPPKEPETPAAEATAAPNPLSDPAVRESSRAASANATKGKGQGAKPGRMVTLPFRRPKSTGAALIAAGLAGGGGADLDEKITGGRVSYAIGSLADAILGRTAQAADPWSQEAVIGAAEDSSWDTNEVPGAVIARIRRARSGPYGTLQNPVP